MGTGPQSPASGSCGEKPQRSRAPVRPSPRSQLKRIFPAGSSGPRAENCPNSANSFSGPEAPPRLRNSSSSPPPPPPPPLGPSRVVPWRASGNSCLTPGSSSHFCTESPGQTSGAAHPRPPAMESVWLRHHPPTTREGGGGDRAGSPGPVLPGDVGHWWHLLLFVGPEEQQRGGPTQPGVMHSGFCSALCPWD